MGVYLNEVLQSLFGLVTLSRERVPRPKTRRMLYTVTYFGNHVGKVGVIKNGTELNEIPQVPTYNLENKTQYVTLLSLLSFKVFILTVLDSLK
jgi:hypothetical protein